MVFDREFLSLWRNRWKFMPWRDRVALIGKMLGVLAIGLVVFWLAVWYFFGPPSVNVGDVKVDLDRSSSLAGTDKDKNGIRDDIDQYVAVLAKKKAYSEPQVKALQQAARSMQGLVTVDINSPHVADLATNKSDRSVHCLVVKFGVKESEVVLEQIESLTANTKSRVIAYVKYNHSQNGTVTTLPQNLEDACDP